MAQLNLRERIVEATIAYIGDRGVANLERVQRETRRGRAGTIVEHTLQGRAMRALEWRPTFESCDIAVTLLAPRDELDSNEIDRLLLDTDGLVLTLDADPAAADRNARASRNVREALLRRGEHSVSVVVQVDDSSGHGDSFDPGELVAKGWPRISACTAKGDGVMETLQRAVDAVVDSIQTDAASSAAPRARASTADGKPLLTALRSLLQAALAEQAAAIDERIAARLPTPPSDERDELRAVDAKVAALHERLGTVDERTALLVDKIALLESLLRDTSREIVRASERDATAVRKRIDVLGDAMRETAASSVETISQRTSRSLENVTTRVSEVHAQRDAVVVELRESRKVLREELARLFTALPGISRLVEGVDAEVKRLAARHGSVATESAVVSLASKTDDVQRDVKELADETRDSFRQFEEAVATALQGDAHITRNVQSVKDALKLLAEDVVARTDAVRQEIAELGEELRKRKKGLFG